MIGETPQLPANPHTAVVHHVLLDGGHRVDRLAIPEPTSGAVLSTLRAKKKTPQFIAWVMLSKPPEDSNAHASLDQVAEYAVAINDDGAPVFRPESAILQEGRLSPHMSEWLTRLVTQQPPLAKGYARLDPLIRLLPKSGKS